MANALELKFLPIFYAAAVAAGHPWPAAAACEAWNETGGQPGDRWPHMPMLADGSPSYNCLGIKAGHGYAGKTVTADGTEVLPDGSSTGPQADNWRVYECFEDCFSDQIFILHHEGGGATYAKALAATTIEDYVTAECAEWSTNPAKAGQVLATYRDHRDLLGG
jgi:hypothetical protein